MSQASPDFGPTHGHRQAKIVFVHGYLGGGSPIGGSTYWGGANSSFVRGAKGFFEANLPPFFTDVEYSLVSIHAKRECQGYQYAHQHYADLVLDMSPVDGFHFVTHSMGGGFAEGMIRFLKDKGWRVETIVYFNGWRPARLGYGLRETTGIISPTRIIDATIVNDPVQFWSLSLTSDRDMIANSDIRIRRKSPKKIPFRHRDFIDDGIFWQIYLPTEMGLAAGAAWQEIRQKLI
ncbi:MAG: type IV secretion protein Rhs [Bacteroidia bacterium]|nr:type IV secretion protein Rhs [Bacteroidia bacterium]